MSTQSKVSQNGGDQGSTHALEEAGGGGGAGDIHLGLGDKQGLQGQVGSWRVWQDQRDSWGLWRGLGKLSSPLPRARCYI